jgi:hypothetical protein
MRGEDFGSTVLPGEKQKIMKNIKRINKSILPACLKTSAGSFVKRWSFPVAILAVSSLNLMAQAGGGGGSGTGFSSTDLKTGISNSLAVIMLFGFVLGIAAVIAGGFAIRRGDVDTGKLSIIGGAVIAAAPAVAYAFFKIFGLDSNATVGVGAF